MYRYLLSADLINTMLRLWQYKNIQGRYDHVPSKVGQRCVSKLLQHIISCEKQWRDEHGQLWEPDGNNQSTDGQTSATGRCDIYFESKYWWIGFSKMKERKRKLLPQRTDKHLGNNKSTPKHRFGRPGHGILSDEAEKWMIELILDLTDCA